MSEPKRGKKIKLIQGQSVLKLDGNNKKRRRPTGEDFSLSKRRNSLPDLTEILNTKDTHDSKVTDITKTMSNIQVEANNRNMLEEIKRMEERLSEKITSNKDKEIAELEERLNNNIRSTIDASIKDALQVMQTSLCTAVQNNSTIKTHTAEIQGLKEENLRLNRKVQQLTVEQNRMKRQITKIETKGLDQCLIIRGLSEEPKENEQIIISKLHNALSTIMQGETEEEKLLACKQLVFQRCRRLGRYSRTRHRPLSVELLHKQDADFILENRFDLPQGIYVDREYPIEIERKRKTLLPVLRAAKKLSNYKKQSRLEDDKLILKGRTYNVNTLNQLPEELNVFKVTSRENENTVGFFGEINPLSNFHPSQFTHDGIQYISSEQLIQANKAKLFGDMETYNQILCCSSSLECKNLAKFIRNVDERKWEEVALSTCLPGIRSKLYQDTIAMDTLLYKTGSKRIVECASDKLWGNGVPLGDPDCLDPTKWTSQGIMGQILECIRGEVTNPRGQCHRPPPNQPVINNSLPIGLAVYPNQAPAETIAFAKNAPTGPTIFDDQVTSDTSASASTTLTSDTTASDTDPGDSRSHPSVVHEAVPMDDITCSSLNTS